MMKLAIIFLPVLFAVIWAAFVGLRINKVEIRENGYNQELVDNFITDKRFVKELVDGDKEYD